MNRVNHVRDSHGKGLKQGAERRMKGLKQGKEATFVKLEVVVE